jgi:hypothetical protein
MTLLDFRDWLSDELYNLGDWVNPNDDEPEPEYAAPEPPALWDVALAMKDDEGNRAQSISLTMREPMYLRLGQDWCNAVYGGKRCAGIYPTIRNEQKVSVGLVLSNILAVTATPHVAVVKTEGDA